MTLTGKTALVTGAAGGIGKAAALRLGKAGANVCINDLSSRAEDGADVVRELLTYGVEAFFYDADVTAENEVAGLVEAVLAKWGKIDILVSNAGISGAGPSFLDLSLAGWERMLRVNLTSHFIVTRTVLPHMIEAQYGRIVTISSVGGVSGVVKCNAHYAAAKGGIIALTKRLARDFAGYGITVNCIAPGFVRDTGFNESMEDERLRQYVSQIPCGRAGSVNDISGIITFLASDEAGWMTGQAVIVDGGAIC